MAMVAIHFVNNLVLKKTIEKCFKKLILIYIVLLL